MRSLVPLAMWQCEGVGPARSSSSDEQDTHVSARDERTHTLAALQVQMHCCSTWTAEEGGRAGALRTSQARQPWNLLEKRVGLTVVRA